MGFDALLGNDRLKQNLTRSLSKGHVSHFYLISGPEGSGKHTLAKLLAAAILCQGEDKPCGRCTPCRKVMDGSHPDFITVVICISCMRLRFAQQFSCFLSIIFIV